MSSKLGQLFSVPLSQPSGRQQKKEHIISGQQFTPLFGTSRVAVQTLSLCLPLCTNHRVYADEEEKKKKKDYPCVLYVTGVCIHAHVPRSFVTPFFCSLRCSITRVHFVYVYIKKYCYCHCYYQLSPDVVTSVVIKQRSLGIR